MSAALRSRAITSQALVDGCLDRIAERMRTAGELALGPGEYALGRGNLALGDAAAAQMKELAYFSAYVGSSNIPAITLVNKLIELAYDNMQAVFLTSGGAESNESAFKTARFYSDHVLVQAPALRSKSQMGPRKSLSGSFGSLGSTEFGSTLLV